MRAAVYCRISNDPSGKAAGVERQRRECEQLVKARGWKMVDEEFTDNDVKATAKKRPRFDALMKRIEDGDVDAVVAWKDDRLLRGGRSKWAHEFLTLIRERKVPVAFVQGQDWDFATAQGRMMVEMRLAISAYEVEQAGERQEARWRQRKQDGKLVTLGRRPFGLKRKGEGMVIVPKEAQAIRRAARDLIHGASLYGVTRDLPKTPYGGVWHPQHVKRMLTSDHLTKYGVLDANTARLVRARLEAQPKKERGRPHREYALSGLVECSLCGSKMAASSGQFHCQNVRCGKMSIKADLLDQYVSDEMLDRIPEPEPDDDEPSDEEAPILRDLARIEDQIAEWAEDTEASREFVKKKVSALERKRAELTARLGRPQGPGLGWLMDWVRRGMPTLRNDEAARAWYREIMERIIVSPAPNGRWSKTEERVEIRWK